MSPLRQRAAWAVVAAAGVLIAFAPAVLGVRTLSHHDTDRLYRPVRTLVVEELRAFRLPLWNPFEGTGMPLLAEGVHGVLHPVSLVGAALAPSSIDFVILSYLVAAALGAFALASVLGATPPASAAAGLAFALSGYSASMTGNLVFLAGLSTLPWVLAAATAAGAGARWGEVAAAVATACAFLSGDAQAAVVGVALGALLAADAGGARGVARALAGTVAGVLVAAVQIVPTGALLPLTYRGLELSDFHKTQWALAPARLLEWVVPGLLRGPVERLPEGASGLRLDLLPFAESVYLGAPVLVAAALGARGRAGAGRPRTRALLAAAAVVLLWLALGHHLGARQLLDGIPVWSRFRYAEKLMAPLALCVSALAATGIAAFAAEPLRRSWTRALASVALLAVAALLALVAAPDATGALALRLLGDAGPFYRDNLAAGLPHLVAGLAALLAADRLRGPAARALALALLVALAPALAVYRGAHLGSPGSRRLATPLRLEPHAAAAAPRLAHPVVALYDRTADPDDVEASARAASALLTPAVNVAARVDTVEPYTGFEPLRLTALSAAFGRGWAHGFRRFGVTHVPIPRPHDPSVADVAALAIDGGTLAQRDDRLELWAVPHRPWAFFARRALAAGGPEDARAAVLDLAARDDGETVVVEASEPPGTSLGRVLAVARGTRSIEVEAESDGPALLVVQDAYWPGWRAAVDGAPAEILAADALVRAVRWPPGRHRLEMVYEPPELRVGLALSAAGVALALLLCVRAARGGRSGAVR